MAFSDFIRRVGWWLVPLLMIGIAVPAPPALQDGRG